MRSMNMFFKRFREIKPDILFVGVYFASYAFGDTWRYPYYLDDFLANVHQLRKDGVKNIVIAGEVPVWSPGVPILVGLDVYEGKKPQEFSSVGLRPEWREVDATLQKMDWGPGVTYVSESAKLCHDGACRRLVGPELPDDLIAFDYGHYTINGSVFAVKTIFAPILDALLEQAGKK